MLGLSMPATSALSRMLEQKLELEPLKELQQGFVWLRLVLIPTILASLL